VGFRNPVSTIGALDTGQGFARGSVQSYTDNPTGALGSALHTAAGFQFRDGISGAPAGGSSLTPPWTRSCPLRRCR
jgi:hypothetical protein